MSAAELRQAAALMRSRAEAATPGAWVAVIGSGPKRRQQQHALVGQADMRGQGEAGCIAVFAGINGKKADDAEHAASWHPAVALAVAKAMDDVATAWEIADEANDGLVRDLDDDLIPFEGTVDSGWLTVARTYLGTTP